MSSSHGRGDDERENEKEATDWLDALLDEVLGGQGPPDLKHQILARWHAQSRVPVPPASDTLSPPAVVVTPAAKAIHRRAVRHRLSPVWMAVSGACLLAVLTTGLLYWQTRPHPFHSPVVLGEPRTARETGLRRDTPRVVERQSAADDGGDVGSDEPSTSGDVLDPVAPDEGRDAEAVPAPSEPLEETSDSEETDEPAITRLADRRIVELINQQLQQRWEQMQVVPAPSIADRQWCNRAYRQLVGREPRGPEVRAFLADPADTRRPRLVDRLLGPEYVQELADYWSRNVTDWWLHGIEGGSRAFRNGLQAHLASQFANGRPLDETFAGLIAASGSNDPARQDFQGATNYLLALLERTGPAELTAQVCRAALGQRLACAACHDGPTGQMAQRDFWQITATLATARVEIFRPGRGRLRDVPIAELGLRYTSERGETLSAPPGGLDGQPLATTSNRSLRAELAEQLVASNAFALATVNRLWESMLQYGFTLPVDDMGPHNPVSHPELADQLAEQLKLHDFQLRDALRWIALSDAFDRSEVIIPANVKDAPVEGGPPLFSRYYHRPRLFTQTTQGLEQLAAGQSPQVTYSGNEKELEALFSRRYGDPSGSGETPGEVTSDQMGQLLPSHFLTRIRALAVEDLTMEQQFEHAYLMVLGRRPTPDEQARATATYQAANGDTVTALERVVWILLNTRP